MLLGDGELKLTRQQYLLAKQEGVIVDLVGQQARHKVLVSLLKREATLHRQMERLLSTILLSLTEQAKQLSTRLQVYQKAASPDAAAQLGRVVRDNRATVDDRDKFVLRLNALLSSESKNTAGQSTGWS